MSVPPPEAPAGQRTIVVADDDIDTLNIIKLKLENQGLKVIAVRDGQAALAAVREHRPSVAIFDVMMPKLNGFQVTRMIKFDKQLKKIPVILLTARTEKTDKDTGMQVGADEYLTKPFDLEQLVELVKQSLDRWLKRTMTEEGTP